MVWAVMMMKMRNRLVEVNGMVVWWYGGFGDGNGGMVV
jgi:hypothetical protein